MSSPLQNNITNLQNLLQQANALPEALINFPYKITVTHSGDVPNGINMVIFYGDDGNSALVHTGADAHGARSTTWTCTNCTYVRQFNGPICGINGRYAEFRDFAGDSTINIVWKLNIVQ